MIKLVETPLPFKVIRRNQIRLIGVDFFEAIRPMLDWCNEEVGQQAVTGEVFLLRTHDWQHIDQGGQWFFAGSEAWYFRRQPDAVAFMLRWGGSNDRRLR
jgi:hypothetical protein